MSKPPTPNSPHKALDAIALLKDHPIFGEFEPAQIRRFASYARKRQEASGTTLFQKGDPGDALFAIRKGSVRIAVPSMDGREAALNVLQPGEIFGEIALLDGQPRTADAVTMSDCELIVIDRRDFIAFVNSEPKVAMKLIELLCARLRFAGRRLEEVVFLNLPARLAGLVLQLLEEKATGPERNQLKITQREIAQMLGTARETVNRVIQVWSDHKFVETKRGSLTVLKPEALAALVRSDDGSHA